LANPSLAATFDATLQWGIKSKDVRARIAELTREAAVIRLTELLAEAEYVIRKNEQQLDELNDQE